MKIPEVVSARTKTQSKTKLCPVDCNLNSVPQTTWLPVMRLRLELTSCVGIKVFKQTLKVLSVATVDGQIYLSLFQ